MNELEMLALIGELRGRLKEATERGDRYHEENDQLFKRAVEAEALRAGSAAGPAPAWIDASALQAAREIVALSESWTYSQRKAAIQVIVSREMMRAAVVIPRPAPEAPAASPLTGELTKIAAECHRTKWQFDFSDENRLPIGRARDMVKRAFCELQRIGDLALKARDALVIPRPPRETPSK